MKNDFTHYLTKFFAEHLPSIKGLSTNTVSSYKDTFLLFINFLDNEKKTNIDKRNCWRFFKLFGDKKKKLYSNKKPEISGYTIFLQLFKI